MRILKRITMGLIFIFAAIALTACNGTDYEPAVAEPGNEANSPILTEAEEVHIYILPAPITDGKISLEQALQDRRSRRKFQDRPISKEQLSQILWAAYGITQPIPDTPNLRGGLRTTPSAGALYPLEIYVVIGNVEGIKPGVYRYICEEHKIVRHIEGDLRNELAKAALGQSSVREAPAVLVHSAVFERMLPRYGERGVLYVYIEVGHSAQNIYLQAEALGLGTVAVGAFIDDMISEVLNLPENESPLYLMPFGYFYGE